MSGEKGFQLAGRAPEIYQNVLVPAWFGPWAEALIRLVDLQPNERVLDVACGTGVVARLAAEAVGADGHVVGLDINAPMLSIARNSPVLAGCDVKWVESDASDTGLESGSFDAVLSQHGYHYLPDKPSVLAEFLRVLVPRGRLAMSIWDDHSVYTKALSDALERYIYLSMSPTNSAVNARRQARKNYRPILQKLVSIMSLSKRRACNGLSDRRKR